MATPDEIIHLLKELAAYYGKEMSRDMIGLYVQSLDEFSFAALAQAAKAHIKESAFFPRISDLHKLAKVFQVDEDIKEARRAHWCNAMEALGAYFRGEIDENTLDLHYGSFFQEITPTEEQKKRHLASVGLQRVDECPVCHGSGCDQDDPQRIAGCPSCQGMGGFRIPLEGEAGAAFREKEPFTGDLKDLLDENGRFKGWG